jgi:hypothetical protein
VAVPFFFIWIDFLSIKRKRGRFLSKILFI